ncbi:hypothetical protein GCM10009792_13600 [Microcella alkalica]|uniref:Uncharacterized protein n=1 Tax=Microcella alkalica TaxID=355930 RepID=A0A839EBE6_9MICO|nr:hypothetical protein [Microcella alkalica]MBA8847038.1 hypothetical protein [Microcella alkalica]
MNEIQTTRPNMPSWAVKVDDDSSIDKDGNPIVYYFGAGDDVYLVRADSITPEGVQIGPLEVVVCFGGDSVQTDVKPTTGSEMRDLADELYQLSYVVDAEQGTPVTPDESDTLVAKFDEDNHDCHRFAMPTGSASVYVWHNTGEAPDLAVNAEQSNLTPGDVTRIVRALRAAEAFHATLTARPTLRPVN